jgi:hypothetical protein
LLYTAVDLQTRVFSTIFWMLHIIF